MAGRGWISWVIALTTLAGGAHSPSTGAQSKGPRLVIGASVTSSFQSRLYEFNTQQGAWSTLYDQPMGRVVDLKMDRDNVGFTAVWEGPKGTSGLHFLNRAANNPTQLQVRSTVKSTGPGLRSVDLSAEDVWVVGTRPQLGHGRLRGLVPIYNVFHDLDNFPGVSIARIVVERKTAKFIFAMNGVGGGVIYSYSVYNRNNQSTLATNLGPITDLIQDRVSGGYLVATRNKNQPIVYVRPAQGPGGDTVVIRLRCRRRSSPAATKSWRWRSITTRTRPRSTCGS